MSALEDPDAAWYHPTFLGQADKIAGLASTAKQQWQVVQNAGTLRPGYGAYLVNRRLHESTQLHYVNAIDPGTAGDWLLPGVELDNVAAARLPS